MEPESGDQARYLRASYLPQSISTTIPSEIRNQEAEIESMLRDLLEGSSYPRFESGSRRSQTIIGWAFVTVLCLLSIYTFYVLFQMCL